MKPLEPNERDERASILSAWMIDYGAVVYRIAFSYVKDAMQAEDIAQEVFLKAYDKMDEFRGRSTVRTWLCAITINACKDYLRSWARRAMVAVSNLTSQVAENSAEQEALQRLQDHDLVARVMKLPLKYREVVTLYYFEELKTTEIAGVLKTSEANVRMRLSRAVARLSGTLTSSRGWQALSLPFDKARGHFHRSMDAPVGRIHDQVMRRLEKKRWIPMSSLRWRVVTVSTLAISLLASGGWYIFHRASEQIVAVESISSNSAPSDTVSKPNPAGEAAYPGSFSNIMITVWRNFEIYRGLIPNESGAWVQISPEQFLQLKKQQQAFNEIFPYSHEFLNTYVQDIPLFIVTHQPISLNGIHIRVDPSDASVASIKQVDDHTVYFVVHQDPSKAKQNISVTLEELQAKDGTPLIHDSATIPIFFNQH